MEFQKNKIKIKRILILEKRKLKDKRILTVYQKHKTLQTKKDSIKSVACPMLRK